VKNLNAETAKFADKEIRINKMALKEFVSNFKRSGTKRFFTV